MGFLKFLSRHLGAAIFGAVGLIALFLGYADQGLDLWNVIEPWQLQALGAALFAVSIIMVLYSWDQKQQIMPESRPLPAGPVNALPAPQGGGDRSVKPAHDGDDKRVILGEDITPTYLMQAFQNRTALHAERATSMYIGKWLRVSGTVSNMSDHGDDIYLGLQIPTTVEGFAIPVTLWLTFLSDRERLEVTPQGAAITAIGRIERISSMSIELKDCELV